VELSPPIRSTSRRGPLLAAVGIAALVVATGAWAGLRRRSHAGQEAELAAQRPHLEEAQRKARAAGLDPGDPDPAADDLKVIEGIGPRAETALHAAGIESYAQLAAARPGRLRKILKASGGRMSDPRTWPEQARLAAAGEWDALTALQNELSRGRRRATA
jgi:predicted flap endonuclease-1-like 5' DNA nuclease